jgi:hypothetical protein
MIEYMQQKSAALLESKLDREQYKDEDLISIKAATNLPYYTNSKSYERAYGSVEINGVEYEYVKRRVYQDTLELLCIPNKAKTHLQTAKNEFFKISADLSSSQQQKKTTSLKISLPDFYQDIQSFSLNAFSTNTSTYFSFNTAFIKADYSSRTEQPPDHDQMFS